VRLAHLDALVVLRAQVERRRGLHVGPPGARVALETPAERRVVPCVQLVIADGVAAESVKLAQLRAAAPPGVVLVVAAVLPAAVNLLAQHPAPIGGRTRGERVVQAAALEHALLVGKDRAQVLAAREHTGHGCGVRHIPVREVDLGEKRILRSAHCKHVREVRNAARIPPRNRIVIRQGVIVGEHAAHVLDVAHVPTVDVRDRVEERVVGEHAVRIGRGGREAQVLAVEARQVGVALEPRGRAFDDGRALELDRPDGALADAGGRRPRGPRKRAAELLDELVGCRTRADGQQVGRLGVGPPGVRGIRIEASAEGRVVPRVGERVVQLVAVCRVTAHERGRVAEPRVARQAPASIGVGTQGDEITVGQIRLGAQGYRGHVGALEQPCEAERSARDAVAARAHVPILEVHRGQGCAIQEHVVHVGGVGRVPVADARGVGKGARVVEHVAEVGHVARLPPADAVQVGQRIVVVEHVGQVLRRAHVPVDEAVQRAEPLAVVEHAREVLGVARVHGRTGEALQILIALEPTGGVEHDDVVAGHDVLDPIRARRRSDAGSSHGRSQPRQREGVAAVERRAALEHRARAVVAAPGLRGARLGHLHVRLAGGAAIQAEGERLARQVILPPSILVRVEMPARRAARPAVGARTAVDARAVARGQSLAVVVPQAAVQPPVAVDHPAGGYARGHGHRAAVDGDVGGCGRAGEARVVQDDVRTQLECAQLGEPREHARARPALTQAGSHVPRADVQRGDVRIAAEHIVEMHDVAHIPARQVDVGQGARRAGQAREHAPHARGRARVPILDILEARQRGAVVEHVVEVFNLAHIPVQQERQVIDRTAALEQALHVLDVVDLPVADAVDGVQLDIAREQVLEGFHPVVPEPCLDAGDGIEGRAVHEEALDRGCALSVHARVLGNVVIAHAREVDALTVEGVQIRVAAEPILRVDQLHAAVEVDGRNARARVDEVLPRQLVGLVDDGQVGGHLR